MKLFFTIFTCLSCLTAAFTADAAPAQGAPVQAAPAETSNNLTWTTDYEDAVKQSTETKKPIILFFTGSDWCGWCKKLHKEVFATSEFAQKVGGKFIFVMVDFPKGSRLPQATIDQNNRLKQKYQVEGFPTVVIVDAKGQRIATAGYRAGGPSQYADYLLKLVSQYTSYEETMKDFPSKKISTIELESLYRQAHELGQESDLPAILQAGIASENNAFFLKEKYRQSIEEGLINAPKTKSLREQLLAIKGEQSQKIHYDLAVIDFQFLSEKLEAGEGTAEATCAPLIDYIHSYGQNDAENLWRLQMTIAQTLLSKGKNAEALRYAQASYAMAPDQSKDEIFNAIQNIEALVLSIHRSETADLK